MATRIVDRELVKFISRADVKPALLADVDFGPIGMSCASLAALAAIKSKNAGKFIAGLTENAAYQRRVNRPVIPGKL